MKGVRSLRERKVRSCYKYRQRIISEGCITRVIRKDTRD